MQFKALKTGMVALLLSSGAHAEWTLDGTASALYYVTTKAAAVSEVNSFDGLSGGIGDDGTATLKIDLATVNTAIEIRDQRMRDILFRVGEYPEATVTLGVDAAALEGLLPGAQSSGTFAATVNLHGLSVDYSVELQVTKLDANTLLVHLAKPLLVGAVSFGLAEGVEELRTIAGLPSISPTVVVDFSLVYRKP